jgi:hypothetical protein
VLSGIVGPPNSRLLARLSESALGKKVLIILYSTLLI